MGGLGEGAAGCEFFVFPYYLSLITFRLFFCSGQRLGWRWDRGREGDEDEDGVMEGEMKDACWLTDNREIVIEPRLVCEEGIRGFQEGGGEVE